MRLEIEIIRPETPTPQYKTSGSAAFDITNQSGDDITLRPGETKLIPVGFRVKVPAGLWGQVSPRSGIALDRGFQVANSPGIVDHDYRGEVGVIGYNSNLEKSIFIPKGERIAQFALVPFVRGNITIVEKLPEDDFENERGEGGFGSTGTH